MQPGELAMHDARTFNHAGIRAQIEKTPPDDGCAGEIRVLLEEISHGALAATERAVNEEVHRVRIRPRSGSGGGGDDVASLAAAGGPD